MKRQDIGQIDGLSELPDAECVSQCSPTTKRRRIPIATLYITALGIAGVLALLAVTQHPRAAPSLCANACAPGDAVAFAVSPAQAIAKAQGQPDGAAPMPKAAAASKGPALPMETLTGPRQPVPQQLSPSAGQPAEPPVTENSLVIPATGVNAPVDQVGILNGSLNIPPDVSRVGSWIGGPSLHSAAGSSLIAGHIDNINQGAGAFKTLTKMRAGDIAYLNQSGLTTRWVTISLQEVSKSDLPQSLFVGASGSRLLHLVSCAGQIHNGSYDDNIIVTLVPYLK